ncbi:MAG TPA: AI-2E family transporter [Myxococcota bacterium]|nr:AI-2E family transporter [Myxococcota bacterium]
MVEERRPGLIVARVLVGLALVGSTLWLLHPFLVPGVWAAIAAYMTWPIYARVRAWTRWPAAAALVVTLFFALAIAVPVGWLLIAFASQASLVANRVQEWVAAGAQLPGWITNTPWLARWVAELRESPLFGPAAAGEWVARYGQTGSQWAVALGSGIARSVLEFGIMLIVLFALYLDGERVAGHARRLALLIVPSNDDRLVDSVGAIVRAVVFGLLGTAVAQGVLAGIGFAIFGVPSPVFFGFATALFSLVPGGSLVIWGGACVWLWAQGWLWAAIGLAAWGGLLVSSVDNLLRPLLISGHSPTRIPFMLVFFGVVGGLGSLGLLGMFVGPVLLAVGFGLLMEFPTRYRSAGSD